MEAEEDIVAQMGKTILIAVEKEVQDLIAVTMDLIGLIARKYQLQLLVQPTNTLRL